MSALAGRWNFGGKPDAGDLCARMLASQQLYGPHDGRIWSGDDIAMGRRLYRTLPEDAYDRQPLHGADGRLTLVADVRLDNRDDLAPALGLPPGVAQGLCDAAMLLASLERWGEEAIDRLVGDFAFALWDSRERKLLLARDFLGQRPLHYHRGSQFFAFATMPKGLHALPDVPYGPDEQSMAEFVALIPDGGGRSFFKDIAIVEPGHIVTVTAGGQDVRRYWNPSRRALARPAGEDFAEGLRHHLDQATRARLRRAGGAIGTQLSAGYDSAAVTATTARLLAPTGEKLAAFTSVPREGYDGHMPKGMIADEGPLAAATAARYPNIEHVLIRAGHVSPLEALDRNYQLFDRPMLNLCNWTWLLAISDEARARGVSVMLTGQMGNSTLSYDGLELLPELLGAGRLAALGRTGRQLVAKGSLRRRGVAANALGPFLPAWLWNAISRLRGTHSDLLAYSAIRPDRLDAMNLPALARERKLDFSYRPRKDGFEARLWLMCRVALGNYNKGILAGWGIDQRDPTADRRLVEYCLGVPMEAYLDRGELRALARRALADRLPQAVLDERGKGYQSADWHDGLAAARGAIETEVNRFAECEPAARTLDIARLRRLVADWPDSGWEDQGIRNAYRLALLRGISAGHFLRRASGTNR